MICALIATVVAMSPQSAPTLKITGAWTLDVSVAGKRIPLGIDSPAIATVTGEKIDSLPLFNPNAGGWVKGAQLQGVRAQETTTPGLRARARLRSGPALGNGGAACGRQNRGRQAGLRILSSWPPPAGFRCTLEGRQGPGTTWRPTGGCSLASRVAAGRAAAGEHLDTRPNRAPGRR